MSLIFESCERVLLGGRVVFSAEYIQRMMRDGLIEDIDLAELSEVFGEGNWRVFDASAWRRHDGSQMLF